VDDVLTRGDRFLLSQARLLERRLSLPASSARPPQGLSTLCADTRTTMAALAM